MRNIAAIGIMGLIVYVVWLIGFSLPTGYGAQDPDAAYKRAMSAPPPTVVPKGALPGLSMVVQKFGTSAGGALANIDMTFHNANEFSVRDAVVKCSFLGASGSVIRSRTETVYEAFNPREPKTVRKVNFGIIPDQAKTVDCTIVSASKI